MFCTSMLSVTVCPVPGLWLFGHMMSVSSGLLGPPVQVWQQTWPAQHVLSKLGWGPDWHDVQHWKPWPVQVCGGSGPEQVWQHTCPVGQVLSRLGCGPVWQVVQHW
jgi:hypothetical protein